MVYELEAYYLRDLDERRLPEVVRISSIFTGEYGYEVAFEDFMGLMGSRFRHGSVEICAEDVIAVSVVSLSEGDDEDEGELLISYWSEEAMGRARKVEGEMREVSRGLLQKVIRSRTVPRGSEVGGGEPKVERDGVWCMEQMEGETTVVGTIPGEPTEDLIYLFERFLKGIGRHIDEGEHLDFVPDRPAPVWRLVSEEVKRGPLYGILVLAEEDNIVDGRAEVVIMDGDPPEWAKWWAELPSPWPSELGSVDW